MLTKLDRYLGRSVLAGLALVITVLLGLLAFSTLMAEMGDVGNGQYTVAKALLYIALVLPGMAHDMLPVACLIGGLIGLGRLASQNELLAMQALGISRPRLQWGVLQTGLLLVLLDLVLSETLVPASQALAQKIRIEALSGGQYLQTDAGLWLRDGSALIHIDQAPTPTHLVGLRLYRISKDNQHLSETRAERAIFDTERKQWQLYAVQNIAVDDQTMHRKQYEQRTLKLNLRPGTLNLLRIEPEQMRLPELKRFIDFLHHNQLDTRSVELAFWQRITAPLATLLMLLLATPFAFTPQRSAQAGRRLLTGTLLGIGFFLLNNISARMSLNLGLSPLLAALAPLSMPLLLMLLLPRQ